MAAQSADEVAAGAGLELDVELDVELLSLDAVDAEPLVEPVELLVLELLEEPPRLSVL